MKSRTKKFLLFRLAYDKIYTFGIPNYAAVAELADALDSKSSG